jgi:Rrf2 family iron-sulfur cluster assembly transcriptional regulator
VPLAGVIIGYYHPISKIYLSYSLSRVPMLSQTAEYALRAAVLMAGSPAGTLAPVGELAEALELPQNYLSKTLNALVRTGVLVSTRGKRGGFGLAHPAAEISLLAIVDPFDRLGDRPSCLMGKGECSEADACAAHHAWKSVSAQVHAFFQQTTLADLVEQERTKAKKRTAKVSRR